MPANRTRRQFLKTASATAAGALIAPNVLSARSRSVNDKLNVGVIGVANRGSANLNGVSGENVVALCDVDSRYLDRAGEQFPAAKKYADFRQLLERNDLDAVVVSTPDHTHAVAAVAALQLGLHVYCEKPLAHSVYEARAMTEAAARSGKATQMGTQIHAGENYRRVVEAIRSGAIGPVREVHVFCGKNWGGGERPEGSPVPDWLSWDLWLGPAPARPYAPDRYHPANWRRFWDFGGGTLADMACHYVDLPFWALDLSHCTSVEAEGPPSHAETAPVWTEVRWEFPARGEQPPVQFTWYDGSRKPRVFEEHGLPAWGNGVLFLGDKGALLSDYGRHELHPASDFATYQAPPKNIPKSIGHHAEWIAACKGEGETTCPFSYSGPMTESVLLGVVAYRTGEKLSWDAKSLSATNCAAAEELVKPPARKGWELSTS